MPIKERVPYEFTLRFDGRGGWRTDGMEQIPQGAHFIEQFANFYEDGSVDLDYPERAIPIYDLEEAKKKLLGEWFPHALAAAQYAIDQLKVSLKAERERADALEKELTKEKALREQLTKTPMRMTPERMQMEQQRRDAMARRGRGPVRPKAGGPIDG